MARPGKQVILDWLAERGWEFTTMTEEQRLEMRRHWNICGASTSSSDYTEPCTFTPMANGRCRVHGGATPKGIASPNTQHGRFSRYMPAPMMETYERAVNDRELLDLTRDIATVEARLDILLKKAAAGDAEKTWKALKGEMKGLRDGLRNGNADKTQEHLQNVVYLVNRAENEALAWEEVERVLELRRRLVDSEAKRRVQARLSMTIEETSWYMRALAEANREAIYLYEGIDKETAERLLRRVAEAFARRTGSRLLEAPRADREQ